MGDNLPAKRCTLTLSSALIAFLISVISCKAPQFTREQRTVQELSAIHPSNKYIKAHMRDGKVYVLYNWSFDSSANSMNGYGSLLDINRRTLEMRGDLKKAEVTEAVMPFNIQLSDIALIETNDPGRSLAAPLAVVTGITGAVAIICLTNPKACFGSCPTFYAANKDTMMLQAEGFSTSIAPSLEKNDIDMLYHAVATEEFDVVVTNEAMETHMINHMKLLVFDRDDHERVFAGIDGMFYKCANISTASTCISPLGDCKQTSESIDGVEYFSLADSTDLNTREELFLTFDNAGSSAGLVIAKRQTLMTTFLMYQGLAYMGNTAGHWLAEMERGKGPKNAHLFNLLGGIEVYTKDANGKWVLQGIMHETGPIATDVNIVPLKGVPKGKLELKLRLNKGLWRLDHIALAQIVAAVEPKVVEPYTVEVIHGEEKNALDKLHDEKAYLVTYPGDAYRVRYRLPATGVELFLDSKGYYLEWMRDVWIKEQSLAKLNMFIRKPGKYLKKAAPEFKKYEPTMEKTFWESRYVHQ